MQPVLNTTQALRQQKMRGLAKQYRLQHFRDSLCGVIHRVALEDYVMPGELALGSDSHSVAWGAVNCVGTGMGEHELAYALVFGTLWFMVPETIKVALHGRLQPALSGKDIALYLAGQYTSGFALYKALEFTGPGASALSVEARISLATHTVELGAKFGLFGYDESTQTFLNERKGLPRQPWAQEPIAADPDAGYAGEVQVDLNQLEPQLACPHRFDNVMPVARAARIPIQQAQVGSCANGHLEDLAAVASVLRGKRVAPGVRLLVQPASWGVYRAALRQGIVDDVLDAGGQILSPGCHLCVGMQGTLPPGDVCITSTTRNFRGRLGSPDAEIYLGSPATVAASALTGVITDPREVLLCK
jgi:3-isopropylmalate/(R)-2-methylmalate dehydratase large subunit